MWYRLLKSFILFTSLAAATAVCFAGDWVVVSTKVPTTEAILLNKSSTELIYVGKAEPLVRTQWSRAYQTPIQVFPDKPLVKFHVISVTTMCFEDTKGVMVIAEEFRTEAFDVIKKIESANPILSDDVRLIGEMPGMREVQDYVCSRKSQWRAVRESN